MSTSFWSRITRQLKHAWVDQRSVCALLDQAALARLADQILLSESRHRGELRVCIEAGLSPGALWRGTTARQRAIELFSRLGVWDTEHNNGVLIYLLVADRRIEILADRGLTRRVPAATWQAAAQQLGEQLHARHFEQGLAQAITQVGQLLQAHYPLPTHGGPKPNELPDAVVVI
jgi:uncharacterized membrane protein